ncbi:PREDICTED: arf-GAP with SH3 domain, ANK repeat and PH domain-containing protein 2-like isoform X1 [Eufriesea mexicana]|uniref:arf-GAP with SH3 domain, ANK repeat and PH domain-containing protein 2-like isoform X1 n=2 Tax=Eufriesea mexicana TaxID=516756 RepID=UPI00083C80C1|nr:PREDICTED: arf-GAP with SH3 domain, ANK repeat and PH domain-containing protein 2-like isoform X1 [Eufriesea mexicana]XP_017758505.1 PREDICTED: arf-GAP with SH3 domain, ANK repeat and PH domain-containing protein 2-like isoform X1 [Eufriesea mexicana]
MPRSTAVRDEKLTAMTFFAETVKRSLGFRHPVGGSMLRVLTLKDGRRMPTLDFDRDGLTKLKKAIKAIHNSGNAHVDNEVYLGRALERLGDAALKEQEPDIGAAFLKFAVVTKELSALMKTLMQNINNIVMFPLDSVLKGDLRGVKGDLKRPFEKAWKDYEAKYAKIEKEKKQHAKEAGLIRTEVTPAEIADEMEKERRLFQLQMCEYLIKVNEIKTKKGIELLQHLVEYYHAQTNYFQDGLKTIEHFGSYVTDLSVKLQKIRQTQDEERRRLTELRNLLRSSGCDKELNVNANVGYSLHQLQGDKQHGVTRSGHLLKKSEGKMRRVWQKRRCAVQAEGYLDICHADENKPPTRVNLLTCQIKLVPDDKRGFDLISYNRTYHFQAEDEADQRAWMSVLVNCKERALLRAFDASGKAEAGTGNPSLVELQQAVIRCVMRLPGNDQCCDCSSQNDATWLSTNFGIIVCIECSGIHRDLGVHISRIQSLTLDNVGTAQLLLARHMTNQAFNEVMEATLHHNHKPTPTSTMEERYEFIRAKYVDKRYVMNTCADERDLLSDLEHAVNNRDLQQLLQVYAESVDLAAPLPTSDVGETALHLAILREMGNSLHIIDFLVQNMSTGGIDRTTIDGETALHLCARHDRAEAMKLLLRAGADPTHRNKQDKTPLDIAQEMGHHTCKELLSHALQRQKTLFDNVNIDWNLSHDEGSTDFSDDETIIEDRNGCLTPEKKSRSRPPSYVGGGSSGGGTGSGDSPVTLRSRSSTCDSLQSGSSPSSSTNRQQMPPPPPPQSRKPVAVPAPMAPDISVNIHGSLKKRVAPPPPPAGSTGGIPSSHYGTLPSSASLAASTHSRTTSEPILAGHSLHTLPHALNTLNSQHHKRSPSGDSSTGHGAFENSRKLLYELPFSSGTDKVNSSTLQRPRNPPPPAPSGINSSRLSNGRSSESLSSMCSDHGLGNPVPPPRKRRDRARLESYAEEPSSLLPNLNLPTSSTLSGLRRCRALYDCEADNEDELSFREGEVIIVTNEQTDDDNWMEGALERAPERRGMFPISFVHMLQD